MFLRWRQGWRPCFMQKAFCTGRAPASSGAEDAAAKARPAAQADGAGAGERGQSAARHASRAAQTASLSMCLPMKTSLIMRSP